MFRRTSKSAPEPASSLQTKGPGAKGRPTPSRKEAEAAARQRAKAGPDKKTAQRQQRDRRAQSSAKLREAMRTGDDRYLPQRDRGPVKRAVRDFIDGRFSVAEFLLPLLVVIMVLQYSGNKQLVAFSGALWTTTILVILLDTSWMLMRLRRMLRERFPDGETRGTTFYALMRAIQIRPLRMPKPQVRIGGAPR